MRNTFFTLLATTVAIAPLTVEAQYVHPPLHSGHRWHSSGRLFQQMALTAAKKYAAKTTATDVRLISDVSMQHDGTSYVLNDSSTYSYAAGRGGEYDEMWSSWNWYYDLGYYYEYNGTTYDPASEKQTIVYNTAGKPDNYLIQEWNSGTSAWDNVYKGTATYDGAGRLATTTDLEWNSTTRLWDNSSRTSYTYTATNKQASYVQEEWITSTSSWENMSKNIYTWNSSDKLTGILWQNWGGSAWTDGMRTSNDYDGSGNMTASLREQWNGSTSSWDTGGKYVYSGFVAYHQPTSAISMMHNSTTFGFDNYRKTNYIYNSYGKPDYEYEEIWNNTTSTWAVGNFASATRYHYETYTPSGVETVTGNSGNATLYPIPASGNITVNATWMETQPHSASITDMCGRIYTSWTMPAAATYHETVPVDNLPSGNYVLTLQGTNEKIVKQFTVVR